MAVRAAIDGGMQQPVPSEPSAPPRAPTTAVSPRRSKRDWAARLGVTLMAVLPALVCWNGKNDDLDLYYRWANELFAGKVPYRDFPVEYPPATLPLFALPRLLFAGAKGYVVAFMAMIWGFDLVQKRLIWQRCGARRGLALFLHTAAGGALYFTYLKRFDVALACLMALGWDALWRAPGRWRSWGLWGAGVLLKLIPVFLAPLWAWQAWRRSGSLTRALAGAAAGLGTVLAGFGAAAAWAGPKAWDWLTYHQARGLQAASTYTAVAMLKQGLGQPLKTVFVYGAAHLAGPWSEHMARLSPLWMAGAVGLTCLRMARHMDHEAGHWRAGTAVLVAVLLTSKVYSPQFSAWLVPFMTLAAVRSERLDWPLMLGLLAVTGLTAELFPGEYGIMKGIAHKQLALVARSASLLTLWAYLLATPRGLSSRSTCR